jgi:hypothetical protein
MDSVRSLIIISAVAAASTAFAPYSSSSSACGLISRQEAANALGAAVPAGQDKEVEFAVQGGSIKSVVCLYGPEVMVTRFELGPKAPALFSQYRESLVSSSDYLTEKGVGNEAFFAKGQLALRKGSTGLIIDVGQNRGGGAKERMKERSLALLAVARL